MSTPLPSPLSASQRSRIRRLARPEDPAQGEEAGELNIVPYLDIITNIMMFVLASVAVAFVGTINIQAAFAGPRKIDDGREHALRLTALVTSSGVALVTRDGHIAPGCGGIGEGVTVPKRSGSHDLVQLSACARQIKSARPENGIETQVTLTASPEVPYETVIAVMDALRRDEAGELFPEVHFGVAR